MTRTIPSYLRLHAASAGEPSVTPFLADPVSQFWKAYTDATGWRLDRSHHPSDASFDGGGHPLSGPKGLIADDECPRILPAYDGDLMGDAETYSESPSVSRDRAESLAAAATNLARRLQQAQSAYRAQEAELAATATPTGTSGLATGLATRLEQLLTKAMAAAGCDAAALYMLDDDTTSLKMRASVGLPNTRIMAPARALRGSRGDLESLVREVVLIDDLVGTMATTWNSPEPFASGIVVRIEEDDLPIGTLWLWARNAHEFEVRDGEAAQLAALGIAGELARASLVRERSKWNLTSTAVKSVTQWQHRQLPPAMEIAPKIIVDGWTESSRPWARSWHAWDVLPDGSIALAIAEAVYHEMDGAMIAATARAAFAAHSNYRHSVSDMLRRISDSLWQTNTGDQLLSMLYLKLDPETGDGEIASAGSIQAIIAGIRGYRPLCGRESEPLASNIDCRPFVNSFTLHPGEAVVAVNSAVLDEAIGMNQTTLASVIRQAMTGKKPAILSSIRRAIAQYPLAEERCGAMLLRS